MVKGFKSTIQGKLKALTQTELTFRLQDYEKELEVCEKEREHEQNINDVQVGAPRDSYLTSTALNFCFGSVTELHGVAEVDTIIFH